METAMDEFHAMLKELELTDVAEATVIGACLSVALVATWLVLAP